MGRQRAAAGIVAVHDVIDLVSLVDIEQDAGRGRSIGQRTCENPRKTLLRFVRKNRAAVVHNLVDVQIGREFRSACVNVTDPHHVFVGARETSRSPVR